MTDTKERVRAVIVRELAVTEDQVTDDAQLNGDLNADSLDVTELIMALEDEFGVKIEEDDIQSAARGEGLGGDMRVRTVVGLIEAAGGGA